jgi:dTDP-4-amino-4,6-dideoxygalactose transaminase
VRAAISRYGARVLPDTQQLIGRCRARGELIQGPQVEEFERAFEARAGHGRAISTSYGRTAFLHMLQALDFPPGSEIILPSLTFWVVPEMARAAGLSVVFADVDPRTFNLDPDSVARLVTARTRAIVPTHLYGLPCDMDRLLAIAARHDLVVLEDCAHALGATYKGRPVGTFGHGALFSFQTLKPLNCYGGGMALIHDTRLAANVRRIVDALPWPSERRVASRLTTGRLQRIFIRPRVFSISLFPILWASSFAGARPDVFLWEKIRPLNPMPESYLERFPNVQGAIGLEGLRRLDDWTAQVQENARYMTRALGSIPGVQVPYVPPDRTHVYYQYCVYGPEGRDRDELVLGCVRRGIDIETLHVDVPPAIDLFRGSRAEADGARRASEAIQIPIYAGLEQGQIERVAAVVARVIQPSTRSAPELNRAYGITGDQEDRRSREHKISL